jgi:hypothetical protein
MRRPLVAVVSRTKPNSVSKVCLSFPAQLRPTWLRKQGASAFHFAQLSDSGTRSRSGPAGRCGGFGVVLSTAGDKSHSCPGVSQDQELRGAVGLDSDIPPLLLFIHCSTAN